MNTEFADVLTAYLMGWKSIRDCAEWISGIDWDDPSIDAKTRDPIARMELLSTEVMEGLRPEAEFWKEAAEFVARETGSLYSQPVLGQELTIADSSNNSTNWPIIPSGAGVEVSLSWSISPQLVSG